MRKSNNLRYYVELEPGNIDYRTYIQTERPHSDRNSFSNEWGSVIIKVGGKDFSVKEIHAEPAKQTTLGEIFLCLLITFLSLYYIPGPDFHIKPFRWIICLSVAWILGLLIGRLRMQMQKADALYFNKSEIYF